ncbi:MAG: hypothetical protein ABFD60_01765 [Bryobacteraceae bacterium]
MRFLQQSAIQRVAVGMCEEYVKVSGATWELPVSASSACRMSNGVLSLLLLQEPGGEIVH